MIFFNVAGSGGPDIPATHPETLNDCNNETKSSNISVILLPKTNGSGSSDSLACLPK